MDTLAIDVETYSSVDIKTSGAYKYCEAPDFQIMLFAYAFNDEEVQIVDFMNYEVLPERVEEALDDPNIIKTAFNANFERGALESHVRPIYCPPEEWQCTMIKALTMGLPGSLDMVGKAMHLPEDKQKMKEGKALIQYFCKPCKPTKANGQRTRNFPEHDPEKWETFKLYCKQDVESERDIRNKLSKYQTTDAEQRLWELDQRINDRGVGTDLLIIEKAMECDVSFAERLENEARAITGLSNPNSPAQLKKWLSERVGFEVTSLTKESVPVLLENAKDDVKRLLELRQLMAKTSIKKYETMKNSRCKDGRVRGLLQFYGANRTGRWAGRLVQVQNLPQNHLPDLDDARNLVRTGQFDEIEFLYDSIPDTLSQLIRTAFVPREGNRFIVADFSAIEARVIAWIAGEQWRLDVFNTHGKIYEASASQMFKVPIESVKKGSDLRAKGKIAELALGYGGSVGAIASMDKDKSIPEEELPGLVKSWRAANPNITKFWWDCDKAAKKAISERTTVCIQHGIKFIYDPGVLFIQLPSGRKLSYLRPKIENGPYDKPIITYEGMEQTSKQWTTLDTYGPKLVENIVQAVARDCLAVNMIRLNDANYDIVMHVHDEVILDTPIGKGSLEEVCNIMGTPIDWAPGLPLRADGYETDYYKKD